MWMATEGSMSNVSTDVIRNMAKRFWGDEKAADFSRYQDKGRTAKMIQDRGFAKENLVVCDTANTISSATPLWKVDYCRA
jgi:hypothetical protein